MQCLGCKRTLGNVMEINMSNMEINMGEGKGSNDLLLR